MPPRVPQSASSLRWRTQPLRILRSAATLLVAHLASAEGATVAANGKVHELVERNFAEAVSGHPWLFVEFYAPWCGHCKKLAPVWEKTAELAKDISVPVAKVDATAEKRLAEEQEVQSFPTLKLFRGSPKVSSLYAGPREADKMVAWLRSWQESPLLESLETPSAAAARTWADKKSLALLGISSGDVAKDKGLRGVLEAASFMLNPQRPGSDIPVGEAKAGASDIGQLIGKASPPAVVFFRKFDFEENVLTYSPPAGSDWKIEPFLKWVSETSVPALIPASAETEKYFLHNIDPGKGLVIYFGDDKGAVKTLHKLAVDTRSREQRLKWVRADEEKFAEGLAKSAGIDKSDFPEVCIWEFGDTEDDDKVFRLSQQPQGFQADASDKFEAAVRDFVTNWQKGKLKIVKDPVVSVTSETFEKHVFDERRDVLVEFYAPWCQHCKALAPEYKQVAAHYVSDSGIKIAKMDATKHKHKSVDIKSYPTIKFYPRSKKQSPIDLPFKTNRGKQSLIEFVEEHRSGGSQSKASKKKEEKKKAQPAPPPLHHNEQAGLPIDVGEEGVWAFDDSMQPESRGQTLSADMVASKSGHTFVRVGGIGVLITSGNPARARAVRRFDSAAAAQQHAQGAPSAKPALLPPSSLPCPSAPKMKSCEAWCAGVAPRPNMKLAAVVGGKPCGAGKDSGRDAPSCNCYDEAHTMMHAMCVSPCDKSQNTPKSCPAGDETCSAGQAASAAPVSAAQVSDGKAQRKFLLYDTKYGEGFNLQREVYPRAGWLVGELNKAIEAKCGSKTTGSECARWTLVLPPWCRVVHWWSGPELVPWRTFFDSEALQSSKVPVIEFEEYVGIVGGNKVDAAVVYTVDEKKEVVSTGKGEFKGWTQDASACASEHRQLPQYETIDAKQGSVKVVYSGHCDGGLLAKKMGCAVFKSPWPHATLDMLSTLPEGYDSVLLKNYDYLLAPENAALDGLGLRESMLYSKEIRDRAENFIATKLGGGPYISAHCRRTDFLRVRTKTTPGAEAIAAKLNLELGRLGVKKVFVATDAPEDLRDDLRKQVEGEVIFFEDADLAFDHPGKQAAAEMWIAARSEFFIGTQESRFTSSIQLERGFLGKPKETSQQEFCKTFEKEKKGKPCINPAHRHPDRKGAHREAYQ